MRVLAFALLLLVSGCDSLGPVAPLQGATVTVTTTAELRVQKDRWDALGIDDYRFAYTFSCACTSADTGSFEVTVRDGLIERAERDGRRISGPELVDGFGQPIVRTIDSLFGRVRDRLISDGDEGDARLQCDEARGFPVEGLGYRVTAFEPL